MFNGGTIISVHLVNHSKLKVNFFSLHLTKFILIVCNIPLGVSEFPFMLKWLDRVKKIPKMYKALFKQIPDTDFSSHYISFEENKHIILWQIQGLNLT